MPDFWHLLSWALLTLFLLPDQIQENIHEYSKSSDVFAILFLYLPFTRKSPELSSSNPIRSLTAYRIPALFVILFFVSSVNIKGQTKEGVSAAWQELYIYHDFSDKWEAAFLFNSLISLEHGFFDWFLEGKVGYKILPWLEAEALFRQEYFKINLDSSKWTYEQRPMFRLSSRFKINKFKFRQRNRIELRTFELFETTWRERNDLRIKYVSGLTQFNLSPYVIEEIFITKRGLSRNRMYLGIGGSKGKFGILLYMLLQSDKLEKQWISRWINGIELNIKI